MIFQLCEKDWIQIQIETWIQIQIQIGENYRIRIHNIEGQYQVVYEWRSLVGC